jgi:hypothetical protein
VIRVRIVLFPFLLLASCATPQRAERRPLPPPRPEPIVVRTETPPTTDEAATARFLDEQIRSREPVASRPTHADSYRDGRTAQTKTDEAATELFLDHEIERRRYVAPAPEPVRIVERIYEPVYVDRYDEYRTVYRVEHDRYRSRFPWNTAVGAGIGAIIGHQSGRRDRGAAIGAGVGLLFDMFRWHH